MGLARMRCLPLTKRHKRIRSARLCNPSKPAATKAAGYPGRRRDAQVAQEIDAGFYNPNNACAFPPRIFASSPGGRASDLMLFSILSMLPIWWG
jgi:hypothetical protein